MDAFYCRECGTVKPGEMVPDDHSVIGLFASEIGLVDAAGQPTAVGNALVIDFYARLFAAAPYLRDRFSDDLLEAHSALDGRGAKQRDSLLKAVLAVMTLFKPGDAERMEKLTGAVESMAMQHVRHGATIDQYAAVTDILLGCLADFARTSNVPQAIWRDAYEPALRRALTYASGRMMAAEAAQAAVAAEDPADTVVNLATGAPVCEHGYSTFVNSRGVEMHPNGKPCGPAVPAEAANS